MTAAVIVGVALWLAPAVIVGWHLRRPESDLERRLRADREVACFDAAYYAPPFEAFRAGEYMDRLSRLALEDQA